MKRRVYVPAHMEEPDIDLTECEAFRVNFQRAILLSLLNSGRLTQAQFVACMDKVMENYAE